MSGPPILVTGATGRLGRLIVERLTATGQPVRVFTRRPDAARKLFGSAVEIAAGDYADGVSLAAACGGIGQLLLLSPISATLAADQIAVADAAAAAGIRRVVKISGSNWTIEPPGNSISGDAHAAVERHLGTLSVEHVSLRPNAWMQVSLANTIAQALVGHPVLAINPDAGVGYIDARDIADVAVHQLLAGEVAGKTLNLTGPQVVTPRQIAALLSTALRRPVAIGERASAAAAHDADFEHRAVAQFATLIAAGRAATTTDAVTALLGRAPRSVEAFISEYLAAEAALAG
ncbi:MULTISPECIES: SDR family oxidoreductase [Rhizobium]|uniref:SDR family oxidoreductase n=1 Tax=Rhizobium phaseoli TaxID=396 RepID=UPI000A1C189D|nr:NmrA family NAD(P)-binding protein [Rhizobium phaseoli]ARM16202.1 NAD-dependent nucleoside-diphosphate-sugar epimerase protein [Rhizobium phaseoli Brasil 5]